MFGLDDAALLDLMHANAQLYLDAGVTTVRDLGDRRFGSLVLRDRYRSDPASGPELVVSGPPLTRRQGHCWFLGGEADTVDELRAAVAERAARGCDVVKVMATGGVITPGFLPHQSQYGQRSCGRSSRQPTSTGCRPPPTRTGQRASATVSLPACIRSSTAPSSTRRVSALIGM